MKVNYRIFIESMGILSVVGSLIFVGMQLVLDRHVAIASQYQSRTELRLQNRLGQFENSDFIRERALSWEKNRPRWWNGEIEQIYVQSGETMEAITRRAITWEMFAINMDNNFYQYQNGLLEEYIWKVFRQNLKNAMRDTMMHSYYMNVSFPTLSPLMEVLSAELEAE